MVYALTVSLWRPPGVSNIKNNLWQNKKIFCQCMNSLILRNEIGLFKELVKRHGPMKMNCFNLEKRFEFLSSQDGFMRFMEVINRRPFLSRSATFKEK